MGRLLAILLLSCFCSSAWSQYQCFERGNVFFFTNESIHTFFFKDSEMALHIMDEGPVTQARYGSLEKAMKQSPCVAGINGGYFAADEQHSPIGLLISQGKKISPFEQGRFTVAGVLYDTGRQIKLERSSQLTTKPEQMTAALQAGPFLVEGGKAVQGLDNDKKAARSFIATDGQGNWCIGMASARSLAELAKELSTNGALGSFKVETALNLDGGSSCAFWAYQHTYLPSYKQVRNYAGIKPRK